MHPAASGRTGAPRLGDLLESAEESTGGVSQLQVAGVTSDSRAVSPGDLFVAIRGSHTDGHAFVRDAAARGCVAAVVEEDVGDLPIPAVRVPSTRVALARIAAALHQWPADRLDMVGITGTIGKTSVLMMLEAILVHAGLRPGVVGSLGVRVGGEAIQETGYTSPDPVVLHRSLSRLVEAGCSLAAMEVTSHALAQERVHGIRYRLGIFTNLVPLEHADYHGSFREYVAVKGRFLDYLDPEAPIVFNTDDLAVRQLVRSHGGPRIGCGASRGADVRIGPVAWSPGGSALDLEVTRSLTRLDGEMADAGIIPIRLRLLGRSNVSNATLAGAAALLLGATAGDVQGALRDIEAPRRRMEVLCIDPFLVIDDTAGHPDSLSAVFEVAQAMATDRVHVVFAIRGSRGVRINRQLGTSLAIWNERLRFATLVVTRAEDSASELNRVADREAAAFREALDSAGVRYQYRAGLADAVDATLGAARGGDLVLLLGAQGMDRGQALVREALGLGDSEPTLL